jgi:Cof subfamily protein (haloacid dehalogenase superfamily)
MSRIAMVVSDVDGTLVTPDKQLTDAARRAVARLHTAGIGFTITSSRPPFGMAMLLEPLAIALPIGPFNGSSVVDPHLHVITQHTIPAEAARQAIALLSEFGVDIWFFTNEQWLITRDDGKYVPHEQSTIRFSPTVVSDFDEYISSGCKIVGASADFDRLKQCETAMQARLGQQAWVARSQSYYLDITPPGQNKGVFVDVMAKRCGVPQSAIATIGDMTNDVPMFKTGGLSIAMGNATPEVKAQATHVTASNEQDGFAKAMEMILDMNGGS